MALTARQIWESAWIELGKTSAPSLLLHEFNYYVNKAINQQVNKNYNRYDVNQQTADNLRVLKATSILTPTPATAYEKTCSKAFSGIYEVVLPDDYLHILNCTCVYKIVKAHKCQNKGDYIDFVAKRLTSDSWSGIVNDYYNRPSPKYPYYYIHNVNDSTNELTPTNTATDLTKPYNVGPVKIITEVKYFNEATQVYIKDGKVYSDPAYTSELPNVEIKSLKVQTITIEEKGNSNDSNFPRVIQLNSNFTGKSTADNVERETAQRYGNASKVRCEIRCGDNNSIYQLDKVLIDYIKVPQTIRLTKEQLDLTEDTSQIMEFPDYVCQEIINELIILVMQRDADPRLQTQTAVTQSIANSAQQQTS